MEKWTPAASGSGFELSPILEPLAAFKDRLLVISGLANNEAHKLEFEIAGDHPRACSAYLTGTHPKMTSGADIRCGVSVDQIAAKEFGKYTQLSSLEIGLESSKGSSATAPIRANEQPASKNSAASWIWLRKT